MKEKWKKCCGGLCIVSNKGKVKLIHRYSKNGKAHALGIIKQSGVGNCYRRIYIAGECYLVHRLVAQAFIGPCPKGKEINHKDLNKGNNCYRNLEYKTHMKNIHHAVKNGVQFGRSLPGEENNAAKLSNDDVHEIRRLHRKYIKSNFSNSGRRITLNTLAKEFNVSSSCIQTIIYNRCWKDAA